MSEGMYLEISIDGVAAFSASAEHDNVLVTADSEVNDRIVLFLREQLDYLENLGKFND